MRNDKNMTNAKKQSIEPGITKQDSGRDVRAVLRLTTGKGSSGIFSTANVVWVGGGFESCMLFSDYSVRLINDKTARATQKAIDTQYAVVFTEAKVAELTVAAKAFYAKTEMVCGGCEYGFTVNDAVTPGSINNGSFECPRCESTDVLTRADHDAARNVVVAAAIAPVPTWTEVTA